MNQLKLQGLPSEAEIEFTAYHEKNPHIFDAFCKATLEAIERGHRHIAARMILEVIRWQTAVRADGDVFKINNNYSPWYARLFMAKYPQYQGYFYTRRLKGE